MSKSQFTRISLAALNRLEPGQLIYDADLKGFGARRQVGAISYFVKTRVRGEQKWITIGRHGAWTPDTARQRAREILADPATVLREEAEALAAESFAAAAQRFLATHCTTLKPTSYREYKRMLEQYLIPEFGRFPIGDIVRSQIAKAHAKWIDRPRAANFALTVLSKFMSWAEDEGLRPERTNPVFRIQRYRENKRERYLQADELARLGQALAKAEQEHAVNTYAIAAIRLLVLTGARFSEILSLKWSYVDLERRLLLLPDSKTGAKAIPLNEAAIGVLKALPRFAHNPYVIVGYKLNDHLKNLHVPWDYIRRQARLQGVSCCRFHGHLVKVFL